MTHPSSRAATAASVAPAWAVNAPHWHHRRPRRPSPQVHAQNVCHYSHKQQVQQCDAPGGGAGPCAVFGAHLKRSDRLIAMPATQLHLIG